MIMRAGPHENPTVSAPFITGVRDVCRIFSRHKWKMGLFFCATLAVVVAGLVVYPRSYTSEARLFVRLGKESVSLDPTATLSPTLNVGDTRESEINSELEVLRSQVLFEDVVGRVGQIPWTKVSTGSLCVDRRVENLSLSIELLLKRSAGSL
jgi:uncharacterized protein involved in exopolysaccharide biosynthesis